MTELNNKKIEQEIDSLERYIKKSSGSFPKLSVTKEEILRNIESEGKKSIPSPYNYLKFIMSKKFIVPSILVVILIVGYFGIDYSKKEFATGINQKSKESLVLVDSITDNLLKEAEADTNEALALVDSYKTEADPSGLDEIINSDY